MTKIERAITALRDCASALEEVPRRQSILGMPFVDPDRLREEANWLEQWDNTFKEAQKEATP